MTMTLGEIEAGAQTWREAMVSATSALTVLRGQRDAAELEIESEQTEVDITVKARLLLEQYSEVEQQQLKDKIEALVTRGLQVIFGDSYSFKIEMRVLRKQAGMEFTIVKDLVEREPLDSHGGGLVNVIALVLRLTILALTPGVARVAVLDEPFAQLSQEYIEPMGRFIREVVDATGIQLIIVSHEAEITEVADQAYRLFDKDGVTQIERVE